MSLPAQSKDWVDYLVALTPICVAAFVAYIGYRQSRYSKEKLRLDLYGKRFSVYERVLVFYQAVASYNGSRTEPFDAKLNDFSTAVKESQFLFAAESNIFKTLLTMHAQAFQIIGFKENGKAVFDSGDHVTFSKMNTDMQDALTGIAFQIDVVEKAMGPYLNFHKIVA